MRLFFPSGNFAQVFCTSREVVAVHLETNGFTLILLQTNISLRCCQNFIFLPLCVDMDTEWVELFLWKNWTIANAEISLFHLTFYCYFFSSPVIRGKENCCGIDKREMKNTKITNLEKISSCSFSCSFFLLSRNLVIKRRFLDRNILFNLVNNFFQTVIREGFFFPRVTMYKYDETARRRRFQIDGITHSAFYVHELLIIW